MPTVQTCGQTGKHCFRNKNVSEFIGEKILLPGKQILFPQQCFPGWANWETLTGSKVFSIFVMPIAKN
jgi:hypothetical protein